MSGQHFTLRRDAQKHTPPRPSPRPPRARTEAFGAQRAPDFWREEERRHTPRAVPLPPADRHARG